MNFSDITDWTIPEGNVTKVMRGSVVLWEKSGEEPETNNYFYVEDVSGQSNTVSIKKNMNKAPTITVYKSTDGTNWSSMGSTSTTAITATIPANGKLYLKATANSWWGSSSYNKITTSKAHNVGGNIMSLLYGDNFQGQTSFPSGSTNNFYNLFSANTLLESASDLTLPVTTLTNNCYQNMFAGCYALTQAPALPATTLANFCYQYMFSGCTSLTTAPALPATTLAQSCYDSMFEKCKALTTAPALPATTLASNCYSGMFKNCTGLTTAPALPATTLASSCYGSMFKGCTSLTTAPVLPATTLADWCYSNMFSGCTSLTTAPALPATTLANSCYSYMFNGCTALTTAPALPATTLTEYCYQQMFSVCPNLNSITTYATDISAYQCLNNWLTDVASTGDFYNLGGATYTKDSPSGIPSGWTEHTSL